MNNFWEDQLSSGYYDNIVTTGVKNRRGIQACWHILTYKKVAKYVNNSFNHLDYACGPGTLIGQFTNANSIGVDLSSNQINYAIKKYGTKGNFMTIENFDFSKPANKFEIITILGLFEYLEDSDILRLLDKIYDSLKPVISACNGDAIGVGATMQLPTDVRIAAKSSRFGFVFAKRGIVPDGCASWFLPKIVGIPMALELCYSGKIIDSNEALRIGLVNYLVEDNELLTKAIEISDLFCNSSAPVSVAMTRHMLWSLSADNNPENSHIIESKLIDSRGASEDAKEGVMSFLEKREAHFKNKISSDLPSDFPWRKSQFNNED